MPDAAEHVILVDEHDNPIGTLEKHAAHKDGGRLHRAFSVFLTDDAGRVLLQRRASTKYHFGGLWTNTACGHPRPGERTVAAAQRRLFEEMGVRAELAEVGTFTYAAQDDGSGLTEREIDHVCLGAFTGSPTPDPEEAEGWRWIDPDELDRELRASPEQFTPWFPLAWNVARPNLP
ncbi:MAG: isopentenyl-diphosphate Delta-isomerase [Phycisphaerales bacterium JB040]